MGTLSKVLIALLLLTLVVPPLQARACSMDETGAAHHAAMSMDGPSDAQKDCCKSGSYEDGDMQCQLLLGCSASGAGGFPATDMPRPVPATARGVTVDADSGVIAPSHTRPPYRPPIV